MDQVGMRSFGPYAVLEQMGQGRAGVIYRARDSRLWRHVALKVLHRRFELPEEREEFLREARAVLSLHHPNIAGVLDVGEEDGTPYLAMELLHGETLQERLSSGVAMPEVEQVAIARQVAVALVAAHAKGVVHRNIRPANIFLLQGPVGRTLVKVTDFELAKSELRRDDADDASRAEFAARLVYMSPEQLCGEELDPRSDLFSLGAVMHEMATGESLLSSSGEAESMTLQERHGHLSPALDAIIRGLLEQKRDHRISSAKLLLQALRRLESAESVDAPQPLWHAEHLPEAQEKSDVEALIHAEKKWEDDTERLSETVLSTMVAIRDARDGSDAFCMNASRAMLQREDRSCVSIKDAEAALLTIEEEAAVASESSLEPDSEREQERQAGDEAMPDSVADRAWRFLGAYRWGFALLLMTVGVATWFFLCRRLQWNAAATPLVEQSLQVTPFLDHTGNAALENVAAISMQILLREMPGLQLTEFVPLPVGATMSAVQMAKQSGANTYLAGVVLREDGGYRLHAEILRTLDGNLLAEEDAEALSLENLPDALSRLAVALRTHLGETPEQAKANTVPLSVEASDSLDALRLYAAGIASLRWGAPGAALELFRGALASDQNFALARLGLLEALRQSGEEAERVQAVAQLRLLPPRGSDCLRARIAYEVSTGTRDVVQAARRWANLCTTDPMAQTTLARVLLEQGRNTKAGTVATLASGLNVEAQRASN